MSSLEVLKCLRAEFNELFDAAIARLQTPVHAKDDGYYSSYDLPPDIRTRARFALICRGIPEATVTGKVLTS